MSVEIRNQVENLVYSQMFISPEEKEGYLKKKARLAEVEKLLQELQEERKEIISFLEERGWSENAIEKKINTILRALGVLQPTTTTSTASNSTKSSSSVKEAVLRFFVDGQDVTEKLPPEKRNLSQFLFSTTKKVIGGQTVFLKPADFWRLAEEKGYSTSSDWVEVEYNGKKLGLKREF